MSRPRSRKTRGLTYVGTRSLKKTCSSSRSPRKHLRRASFRPWSLGIHANEMSAAEVRVFPRASGPHVARLGPRDISAWRATKQGLPYHPFPERARFLSRASARARRRDATEPFRASAPRVVQHQARRAGEFWRDVVSRKAAAMSALTRERSGTSRRTTFTNLFYMRRSPSGRRQLRGQP